jgi:hypothetical protein
MLVVVLPLPLSWSMYDGELYHSGGSGSGGGPAAAVAVAVAVAEDNYWQKWPALRALTVT